MRCGRSRMSSPAVAHRPRRGIEVRRIGPPSVAAAAPPARASGKLRPLVTYATGMPGPVRGRRREGVEADPRRRLEPVRAGEASEELAALQLAVDQQRRCIALRLDRRLPRGSIGCVPYAATKLMSDGGAVRTPEVVAVLDVRAEVRPARVRLEHRVAGLLEERLAHLLQRRHTGVAAAHEVQRRQVERQAEQVVAQRVDRRAGRSGCRRLAVMPLMSEPVASSGETVPPRSNSSGFRKPSSSGTSWNASALRRSSSRPPARDRSCRSSSSGRTGTRCARTRRRSPGRASCCSRSRCRRSRRSGASRRPNSSNTRCWYCISVANFAAWNRRCSYDQSSASGCGSSQPTFASTV